MTHFVGDQLHIEPEEPSTCELCSKFDELRPYGPNGENICFDCGIAHLATTMRSFSEVLDRASSVHAVLDSEGVIIKRDAS